MHALQGESTELSGCRQPQAALDILRRVGEKRVICSSRTSTLYKPLRQVMSAASPAPRCCSIPSQPRRAERRLFNLVRGRRLQEPFPGAHLQSRKVVVSTRVDGSETVMEGDGRRVGYISGRPSGKYTRYFLRYWKTVASSQRNRHHRNGR